MGTAFGGGCSYPQGNQVAAAEAFLLARPGAVSFTPATRCGQAADPTAVDRPRQRRLTAWNGRSQRKNGANAMRLRG